jgi:hypothetical protein
MLYYFFINRDINDFNARIIPITDIKNDIIESCKESSLLFFADNISKFMKRYPRKLAYIDYLKFGKNEKYIPFGNIKFGLKLKSVVNFHKTSKYYKTVRYYRIKDEVKARYDIEELELNENDDEIQDE